MLIIYFSSVTFGCLLYCDFHGNTELKLSIKQENTCIFCIFFSFAFS